MWKLYKYPRGTTTKASFRHLFSHKPYRDTSLDVRIREVMSKGAKDAFSVFAHLVSEALRRKPLPAEQRIKQRRLCRRWRLTLPHPLRTSRRRVPASRFHGKATGKALRAPLAPLPDSPPFHAEALARRPLLRKLKNMQGRRRMSPCRHPLCSSRTVM